MPTTQIPRYPLQPKNMPVLVKTPKKDVLTVLTTSDVANEGLHGRGWSLDQCAAKISALCILTDGDRRIKTAAYLDIPVPTTFMSANEVRFAIKAALGVTVDRILLDGFSIESSRELASLLRIGGTLTIVCRDVRELPDTSRHACGHVLPASATVHDLKRRVEERTGTPVTAQRMVFCGRQVRDIDVDVLTVDASRRPHPLVAFWTCS